MTTAATETPKVSLARLRGAVDRVMSDSREQLDQRQPNIWSEVARGLKNARGSVDERAGAVGGKSVMKSLYQHLDSTYSKPTT